ncbi:transcription-repair coupling factor [Staphylospora marina]|uniref:transcription-repair coupling factor n=1 Tax=Staphylospora marina TaxID=2490858 RepID=UPI000F5BE816|nr:transcription-repair coupling factor [Staphylospora marina]
MLPLVHIMRQDNDFRSTVAGLKGMLREQLVSGLSGTARMLFVAALHMESKRPVLLVTHNLNQAQKAVEDLQELIPKDQVLMYPANELVTTEIALAGDETLGEKLEVLSRVSRDFSGVLVVPFSGLRKLFPPKRLFAAAHARLKVGQVHPIGQFAEHLVKTGYVRTEMVEKPGEFSVRGGIVDVYPANFDQPVRIEWFDDEVDSIRPFSVDDQRSLDKWSEVLIPPAKELFGSVDTLRKAADRVQALLDERMAAVRDAELLEKLREGVGLDVERLRNGTLFTGVYKYVSQIYPDAETLLHYLSKDTVIVLDEPTRILESARQMEREEAEWQTVLLKQGEMLPGLRISVGHEEVLLKNDRQRVHLSLFLRQVPGLQPQNIVQMMCRSMQQFHGQMHVLKTEWERWVKGGFRLIFMASSEERADRLERVLGDYGMKVHRDVSDLPPAPGKPVIRIGALQSGFELAASRLAVVTEGEVFTQKQRRPRRSSKLDHAEKIKGYQELKPGDYVVHVNHGIGRYLGIETLEVGGLHKDYLHIQYAGNDKLYVPVEQIDQIQKYVGSEDKAPKIYSLGGGEWSKVKNKVRSSVQDIAQELLELYAKRQQARGYAFSKDTPYQKEFEAMFPYEETPDQLRSIEEIKKDMESPQPMDRLLCGDVGYGKTEVAIRAAFKAAMDGKQVAVLVPTTILAQQHYETFRERFAEFPVTVRVLNRFRTRKEQKETLEGLANGTVDVVIGTHRLLSKDVRFKDLGLLIIDEEQRFGVKHKEKIKQLKHQIDVLTLTATPIPRTLHMAMIGVRDLSVIETPPENRFPVQTYVLEYSGALVREAIERELARGGQVYFLYNQVQNIERMAEQIRMLVPDARVAVAHGQMPETELERVMLDFLDGEYDVLVSTTIIETGVDIPNVNTLIIYDADKMGLSQLYQLRGRVGRSNRIAYSYFTYQRDKVLSEAAEKRLQAIKEFTELGSGFKIAMRDLSIRGAGNILGAEQHGHIASVGFELYSQMLKEAVAELQGKPVSEEPRDPVIELSVDAYLPSEYIRDEKQKIELYKKIRAVRSVQEAIDLEEEIEDRFGDLPDPVRMLLKLARIKAYAIRYGFEAVEQQTDQKGKEKVVLWLPIDVYKRIDWDGKMGKILADFPTLTFSTGAQRFAFAFPLKGLSLTSILDVVETFLARFENALEEKGVMQDAKAE